MSEFEANKTRHKTELKQNVTALLAALPAAYQQFSTIVESENLTPLQIKEAVRAFRNSSMKVRKDLKYRL